MVWVAVGADPLAQLPRVAGRLGAHYLSSFVFPLQLLYFLVLALRLGDAEQPSESLSWCVPPWGRTAGWHSGLTE